MSLGTAIIIILLLFILFLSLYVVLKWKYGPRNYLSREYWAERFRPMHKELVDLTEIVHDIFAATGITYWMHDGTLLGAIRHGGFIPWDDDIDLCVYVESGFWIRWQNACHEFKRHGIRLEKKFFGWALSRFDPDAHVDLFFFTLTNNHVSGEWVFLGTPRSQVMLPQEYHRLTEMFPLKLYKFDRLQLYGPRNAWDFLSHAYSPNFFAEGRLDVPHSMQFVFNDAMYPRLELALYPVPRGQKMPIMPEEVEWAHQFSPIHDLLQTFR